MIAYLTITQPQRIVSERERLKMTTENLAAALGIKVAALEKIESGASVPKVKILSKLAECGFDLAYVCLAVQESKLARKYPADLLAKINREMDMLEMRCGNGFTQESREYLVINLLKCV